MERASWPKSWLNGKATDDGGRDEWGRDLDMGRVMCHNEIAITIEVAMARKDNGEEAANVNEALVWEGGFI